MNKSYEKKTSLFRQLHEGPPILVVPNAWDVASAKIFSALAFPAIATTSSGIANCFGYADGENIRGVGERQERLAIPSTALISIKQRVLMYPRCRRRKTNWQPR